MWKNTNQLWILRSVYTATSLNIFFPLQESSYFRIERGETMQFPFFGLSFSLAKRNLSFVSGALVLTPVTHNSPPRLKNTFSDQSSSFLGFVHKIQAAENYNLNNQANIQDVVCPG